MTAVALVRYDIEINLVSNIAEAIPPIYKEDGKIDTTATDDYHEFIINVFAVLDGNEFEIVEEETDPKGETSYCITAFKKSESTTENVKYIFSIKVLGQYSPEDFEVAKSKSIYRKPTWGVQNVIINGDIFDSYDEALEGLDKELM